MRKETGAVTIVALVIAAGIVSGFVGATYLPQGNPLVTLPWGVIALLIGIMTQKKKPALLRGGLFGFVASYAYLWFDNTSGKSLFLVAIIFVPAAFGLLCGLGVSWLGWAIRSRV